MTVFKYSLLLLLLFNICRSDEVNVTFYLEMRGPFRHYIASFVCETNFDPTTYTYIHYIHIYEGIILRIPDEHRHLLPSTKVACFIKSEHEFDMDSLITEVEGSFQVKWLSPFQTVPQTYIPDYPLCTPHSSSIEDEEPSVSFEVEYEYKGDDGIPASMVELFGNITDFYCLDLGWMRGN